MLATIQKENKNQRETSSFQKYCQLVRMLVNLDLFLRKINHLTCFILSVNLWSLTF